MLFDISVLVLLSEIGGGVLYLCIQKYKNNKPHAINSAPNIVPEVTIHSAIGQIPGSVTLSSSPVAPKQNTSSVICSKCGLSVARYVIVDDKIICKNCEIGNL